MHQPPCVKHSTFVQVCRNDFERVTCCNKIPMTSFYWLTVTVTICCSISEICQDIGQEMQFSRLPAFNTPLRLILRILPCCSLCRKLERWAYWAVTKSLMMCAAVLTHYQHVTYRETDRWTCGKEFPIAKMNVSYADA